MIKKIVIGTVVTLVALLIICLVPLKEVAYTVTVDYQDTETYYEAEPYEETETYTETVPLDYEVVDSDEHIEGTTPVVSVTVQNTDSVSATLTIRFSIKFSGMTITKSSINIWSKEYSDEKELHLKPGEAKTAKHRADYVDADRNDWSWNYEVSPDTKTVEKQRTVTKYKQVERQRTVVKQRPETRYKKVTLLDYSLHY